MMHGWRALSWAISMHRKVIRILLIFQNMMIFCLLYPLLPDTRFDECVKVGVLVKVQALAYAVAGRVDAWP